MSTKRKLHFGTALFTIAIMLYLYSTGRMDMLYAFAGGSLLGEFSALVATDKFNFSVEVSESE